MPCQLSFPCLDSYNFFGDIDVDDFAPVVIFHFPSHTANILGRWGAPLGAPMGSGQRGGQGRLATPQKWQLRLHSQSVANDRTKVQKVNPMAVANVVVGRERDATGI